MIRARRTRGREIAIEDDRRAREVAARRFFKRVFASSPFRDRDDDDDDDDDDDTIR